MHKRHINANKLRIFSSIVKAQKIILTLLHFFVPLFLEFYSNNKQKAEITPRYTWKWNVSVSSPSLSLCAMMIVIIINETRELYKRRHIKVKIIIKVICFSIWNDLLYSCLYFFGVCLALHSFRYFFIYLFTNRYTHSYFHLFLLPSLFIKPKKRNCVLPVRLDDNAMNDDDEKYSDDFFLFFIIIIVV